MTDEFGPLLDPHAQAEELARLLQAKGFPTTVHKKGGHQDHPCVRVSSGRWRLPETTDYVYLVHDRSDDRWWFWWYRGWSEVRIAHAEQVSLAADVIGRAIAELPKKTAARTRTTFRAVQAV